MVIDNLNNLNLNKCRLKELSVFATNSNFLTLYLCNQFLRPYALKISAYAKKGQCPILERHIRYPNTEAKENIKAYSIFSTYKID